MQVFREFFPVVEDFITLECVWKSDKFVLLEKKHTNENVNQGDDSGGSVSVGASAVNYTSIESFLEGKNVDAFLFCNFLPSSLSLFHTIVYCIVQFWTIIRPLYEGKSLFVDFSIH